LNTSPYITPNTWNRCPQTFLYGNLETTKANLNNKNHILRLKTEREAEHSLKEKILEKLNDT
jgi:hypothetical protein